MTDPTNPACPICGVTIEPGGSGGDRVIFSTGPAGTRAKLWARVCQYNKKSGCINEQGKNETISENDYYKDAPGTSLS